MNQHNIKKLLVVFFILNFSNFSVGRRPFVDPTPIRSRISDEFDPFFRTSQQKFSELDEITATNLIEGVKAFADTIFEIRNSITAEFKRVYSCGYCKNVLNRYEIECNANIDIIWQAYSHQRVRMRLEEEIQNHSEFMLKPIRNFIEELKDYKSNYLASAECWRKNKLNLFEILDNTPKVLKDSFSQISNDFHVSCMNTSSRFLHKFNFVIKEIHENCSTGFGLCHYLNVSKFLFLAVINSVLKY